MAETALLNEEIAAGAELARRFDPYMPVEAAFWLKSSEDDSKYFYLATEQVNSGNLDLGYGEIFRLTDEIKSIYMDPFYVKLIGTEDPLAHAAVAMNNRFPNENLGTKFGRHMFGGIFIEYGYLYPKNLRAAGR